MAPAKMSFDPQAARCFACGKQGHVAAACPNPSKKTACHLCGGEGHKAHRCAILPILPSLKTARRPRGGQRRALPRLRIWLRVSRESMRDDS